MRENDRSVAMQWLKPRLRAGMAGLLALALSTAATVAHAQPAPAAKKATGAATSASPAAAGEEQESSPRKPGEEGVKVHGHWAIDVRNADGSLARHVEFENSLVSPAAGDNVLAQLLAGLASMGDWAIEVNNSSGTGLTMVPPCTTSTELCEIVGTTTGPLGFIVCAAVVCTPGLTMTYVPSTATSSAGIQLTGNLVAVQNGSVMRVQTKNAICTTASKIANIVATTSPSQCLASNSLVPAGNTLASVFYFTATTLATPISFTTGQTITFTVNVSFS